MTGIWKRCVISATRVLTIEREVGDQPVKDIEMAVRFLRGFLKSEIKELL